MAADEIMELARDCVSFEEGNVTYDDDMMECCPS